MRTRARITLPGLALGVALAGGAAWATIPDGNGVYTACKLNATGPIRLIDRRGAWDSQLTYETGEVA